MSVLNLGDELDLLSALDVDKAFTCVVRWLREENTARFFTNHPAAREAITTVLKEVIRPKPLLIPDSIPCNTDTPVEQAPTTLLSQHFAQGGDLDSDDTALIRQPSHRITQEELPDRDDQTDQRKRLFVDAHARSSLAAQDWLEKVGHPLSRTYTENAGGSESEQTGGSANLDDSHLTVENDGLRNQNARSDGQFSGQTVVLSRNQSDTMQDSPRKRNHNFEGSQDSKRIYIEAANATESELGIRSPQGSRPFELWSTPNQNERPNQQCELSEASQGDQLLTAAVTVPAPAPVLNYHNSLFEEEGSSKQHQNITTQEVLALSSTPTRRKFMYESFANSHNTLLKIAKEALSSCLETHREQCPLYPLEPTNFLPTRLLDIENLERPRLVITSESDFQDRRYIPLSHEWGNPDEREQRAMTTTSATLGVRLDGFDLWSLPARFIEAIFICHLLNIRYIWIDSLCIVQDSIIDWELECPLMSKVYESGYLTICSNLSGSTSPWIPPSPVSWYINNFLENSRNPMTTWYQELLWKGPLGNRAWCLQERRLSYRILHIFHGQTWMWECNTRARAHSSAGLIYKKDIEDDDLSWTLGIRKDRHYSQETLLRFWDKIMCEYSRRTLTFQSDIRGADGL